MVDSHKINIVIPTANCCCGSVMDKRFCRYIKIKIWFDFTRGIGYNHKAIAQICINKQVGGGFCEKNISTEQKETPKSPRIQISHEISRRS